MIPASSAIGRKRLDRVSVSSDSHCLMKRFMVRFAARESAGTFSPGLYLPVRTPWASGDQTIWLMPLASQSGITSASGLRHSAEYWG